MFQGEDLKADEHQDSKEAAEAKEKIFPFLYGRQEPEGTKTNGAWVEQLCSTVEWFVEIEDKYLETQLTKIKKEEKDSGQNEIRWYFTKLFLEVTDQHMFRRARWAVERLKQNAWMTPQEIKMIQEMRELVDDLSTFMEKIEGKTARKISEELTKIKDGHSEWCKEVMTPLEEATKQSPCDAEKLKKAAETAKIEIEKETKILETISTHALLSEDEKQTDDWLKDVSCQIHNKDTNSKDTECGCLSCCVDKLVKLKKRLTLMRETPREAPVSNDGDNFGTDPRDDCEIWKQVRDITWNFEALSTRIRRFIQEELSTRDDDIEKKVTDTIEKIEIIFNPRKILQQTQESQQTPVEESQQSQQSSQQSKALRELIEKAAKEFGRKETDMEYLLEYLAECLYGLIHAKYITTRPGLMKMAVLFQNFTFGKCPRFGCAGCPLLPIGMSDDPVPDDPRQRQVCVFCPLCHDIYRVQEIDDRDTLFMDEVRDLNGAFFGTSFPGLFMVTFPPFSAEVVNDGYGVPLEEPELPKKDFKRPGVRLL